MFGSVVLGGVGLVAVGFAPNAIGGVVLYAVCAFGVAVWNVPWGSLRQQLVPGRLLGRVTGLIRTVGWGLFPIGAVLGGLVARIDLRLPFWIGGGLVVLVILLASRLVLSIDSELDLERQSPADLPTAVLPYDVQSLEATTNTSPPE
jgi:MFS family permease